MTSPDPLLGYAVHFTRGNDPAAVAKALAAPVPDLPSPHELMQWQNDIDGTGYWSSLSILWEGHVRPTRDPLGVAASVSEVEASHGSACFSATRLDKLARLINTRSLYGVGFEQNKLAVAGGRPVQYLRRGSPEAVAVANDVRDRQCAGVNPADPFWKKTPFIDPDDANAWEDEWRVPRGLRFEPDDVAFVFLPEELHENARAFFEEHRREHTGPAYLCRYIDPRWEYDHIACVLAAPGPAPPTLQRFFPSRVSAFAAMRRSGS